MENKVVEISPELYRKIEERVKDTEFKSVEEYVVFVLEEVLKDDDAPEEHAFSEGDEEKVKERLRGLGYL